jgi:hypothetical protein
MRVPVPGTGVAQWKAKILRSIMVLAAENQMNASEDSTVLSSWKDIARYLGKGVRTVQRWERHLGLPVRRPNGALQKSAVVLYRGDVDAWLASRFSARSLEKSEARTTQSSRSARSTLREGIRTARALRIANQELTEQISHSIRRLTERCELLQSLQDPGLGHYVRPSESLATDLKTIPDLLPNTSILSSEQIA